MKKTIILFACLALCVVGSVLPAFAVDEVPDDLVPLEEVEPDTESEAEPIIDYPADYSPASSMVVNTTMSLNPRNGIDSALSSTVKQLFGEYTPRTQTITQYTEDGNMITYTEVVGGLAGLDWEWLATFSLFAIVIYCVLRMIGGVLKWN